MKKQDKIIINNYDQNWAKCFHDLKLVFERHLGSLITSVEHVGSTSVVGLVAKPIIDLDLIFEDNENIRKQVISKLEEIGYVHVGDLGIPEREAFKRSSRKVPTDGSNRDWMNHHLYACKSGTIGLLNHIRFRDYLRENPEATAKYGILKKKLATKYPYDIDSYVKEKTGFIVEILKKLSFDDADLIDIEDQNRSK